VKRLLTLVAAIAGLAALPAAPAAASTTRSYEFCVNTHTYYGVICNFDIGPLARQITDDPVGFVCGDPAISCKS
jgi:hypothetical protein